MPATQRLHSADVRSLLRLVGQAARAHDAPAERLSRALRDLLTLTAADSAAFTRVRRNPDGQLHVESLLEHTPPRHLPPHRTPAAHPDHAIQSIAPLGHLGHYACLTLHRSPTHHPPFTPREHLLADVAWTELSFLHDAPLTHPTLSPDLTDALRVLLTGAPLTTAARRLGLTPATMSRRARTLYQTFHVADQRQLLARFIPPGTV